MKRHKKNKRVRAHSIIKISHKTLCGLAFFSVVAVYVGMINMTAVKGSSLRNLERKIAQLEEKSEQLSLDEAQLRASIKVTDEDSFEIVKEEEIRYLASIDDTDSVKFEENLKTVAVQ